MIHLKERKKQSGSSGVSVIVQEDPAGFQIGHNASIAALTDGQSSLAIGRRTRLVRSYQQGVLRGGCI